MKTAKEMFEDLGCIELRVFDENQKYFVSKDLKSFHFECESVDVIDENEKVYLSPFEVKAIYKQCQELGWLDEE